jgi:pyruvate dehydrogenase E2 component (dihydrolipoamide acetyltransferase)
MALLRGGADAQAGSMTVLGFLAPRTERPTRTKGRRVHGWRKLAGATWGPPRDPQFFGALEIDAEAMQDFAQRERERTGVHVTMTHLVSRAVARGLSEVPSLGMRLAHGREYARDSIDVFVIVAADGGDELTGVKIEGADRMSAVEIALALALRTAAIAAGADQEFGRAKQMLTLLPPRVLRHALRLSAWLSSDLHLDLPGLGVRKEAFGGAMVTSVGMWDVPQAYSPLAAYYRVPLLVCVGAVVPRPVAVDGQVVVRPMFTLTATFDHRYVDGYHAAQFAKAVRAYCADPD